MCIPFHTKISIGPELIEFDLTPTSACIVLNTFFVPSAFNINLRYLEFPFCPVCCFQPILHEGGRGRPPRRSLSPNLLASILSVTSRKQPIFCLRIQSSFLLFNICPNLLFLPKLYFNTMAVSPQDKTFENYSN